jgi:nicotinate-nucleotide--dimethylbenzimidazole phosphoribosyltransferase
VALRYRATILQCDFHHGCQSIVRLAKAGEKASSLRGTGSESEYLATGFFARIACKRFRENFIALMKSGITTQEEAASAATAAEVFSSSEQEIIHRLILARRDIRHFRPDLITDGAICRILEAAHAAPSVGLMQPWNFILIDSLDVRRKIKSSFEAVNSRERSKLEGDVRSGLYDSLKLEGILEAPLNIAVTCDHSRGLSFVLGHAPMPQTALYSVCLAVENLWLAARVEGVGVGWVSILEPQAVAQILELPPGVELVAYLCIGYPLEFRAKPLLEEVGWKRREKLEPFVFGNRWGNPRAFTKPRVCLLEQARPVSETEIARTARQKIDRKTKPIGSLGVLEQVAVRLASLQLTLDPALTRKRICVYAGTHGVTAEGVSAYPGTVTGQMVLNFLRGGAAINVLARHAGIELYVIDTGVDATWPEEIFNEPTFFSRPIRSGTRNFLKEPAMTPEECERAIEIGREQVRIALEQGVHLLGIGEMGIGNTTSASCLLAVMCGFSPSEAVGRGSGVSDTVLVRKTQVIAEAIERHSVAASGQPGFYWLRVVGGFEIAAMTGTILAATQANLPIVVDGFIATAAAAVAFQMDRRSRDVCFFSHRSDEQAHGKALRALSVEPLLDLKMRLGEGTGAALAMPILEASAKLLCEMATFDTANVARALVDQEQSNE